MGDAYKTHVIFDSPMEGLIAIAVVLLIGISIALLSAWDAKRNRYRTQHGEEIITKTVQPVKHARMRPAPSAASDDPSLRPEPRRIPESKEHAPARPAMVSSHRR